MTKSKTMLLLFAVILAVSAYVVPALAENKISVSPSVINVGGSTTITLTTESAATGSLKVKDPNGNEWTAGTAVNIGPGGGSQSWVYPVDFTGADSNTEGSYDVTADVDLDIGRPWHTTFMVEFFVIPELPLGIIAATTAGFAAFGITKKFRKYP